jgi:LuxR family glucitol operon transcriptional activator
MTLFDDISLSKLQEDVHQALKLWHSADPDTSPLDYLYLFQQIQRHSASNTRQATNELLLDALKALEAEHGEDADLLRLRFLDGMVMHAVANQLNLAESTANKKQRQTIRRLAVILCAQERQARAECQAILERRLALPPSTQLIGVEKPLKNLLNLLGSSDPPYLISIEGLGGIGKTALANALVREIALTSRFYDIAWVSAKQQEFLPGIGVQQTGRPALDIDTLTDTLLAQLGDPDTGLGSPPQKMAALSELLKKQPYLVVIDNLETVADYQTLLPVLRQLANPGKVLLTSRHSLQAHSDVSCLHLQELSRADTLAFLKHEAKVRSLSALANAPQPHLESIYEVVGGNPLALKLIVGQICALPLSRVLEGLRQARGKKIDELYTHIYRQAWQTLDVSSRQLLLVMPLAQNGTIDQLVTVSGLEMDEIYPAIEHLVTLSLLEVSGDIEQRRYRIHRLTETFLLTEVTRWQSE